MVYFGDVGTEQELSRDFVLLDLLVIDVGLFEMCGMDYMQNAVEVVVRENEDGEDEPVNDEPMAIERDVNPNPTATSFEQFQESLFSQLNIRKHLSSKKLTPIRMDIPLCRLFPTTWVRQALESDIQTVYEGFHIGNWGTNFWVTTSGNPGPYPSPNFTDRARWATVSEKFDSDLRGLCDSDPENKAVYERMIGRYVNVWDGNHRAIAWLRHIQDNNGEPIKVNCFVLNDTEKDQGWISNFMRDINE